MTAQILSALSGTILSLAFSFLPGLSTWYEPLDTVQKRAIMGLLVLFVATVAFALSCSGLIDVAACNRYGAFGLAETVFAALVMNQSVYLITNRK